jgi:hypothetical protein
VAFLEEGKNAFAAHSPGPGKVGSSSSRSPGGSSDLSYRGKNAFSAHTPRSGLVGPPPSRWWTRGHRASAINDWKRLPRRGNADLSCKGGGNCLRRAHFFSSLGEISLKSPVGLGGSPSKSLGSKAQRFEEAPPAANDELSCRAEGWLRRAARHRRMSRQTHTLRKISAYAHLAYPYVRRLTCVPSPIRVCSQNTPRMSTYAHVGMLRMPRCIPGLFAGVPENGQAESRPPSLIIAKILEIQC